MHKLIYVHLVLLSLLATLSHQFEINQDYDNYDQLKQQQQLYLNLQAAQKNMQKKLDISQYSESNEQEKSSAPPKIRQDYTLVENWPTSSKKLGAVSAVALDVYNNVVVFHRVDRAWKSGTFDMQNIFQDKQLGPINEPTVVTFDRETGNVLSEWGKNLFYLPHGLHINGFYYYITDVALHQVFRFNIKNSTEKPDLVLGEAFKPGRSASRFCKPTAVASLENGDFFVADGYCNSRIVKYSFSGKLLLEWGKGSFQGDNQNLIKPPNEFAVPHALVLVSDKNLLCVADRENGRVQCFYTSDGKFHSQYHSDIVGSRLFSVDYANNTLFVVNGPEFNENREIAGYGFSMDSGDVTLKFGSFLDPHDLAVTSDSREIYVGDLSKNNQTKCTLHKFVLNGVKPTITREGDLNSTNAEKSMHRGETFFLVGSILFLFLILAIGVIVLISKRKKLGNEEQYTLMQK